MGGYDRLLSTVPLLANDIISRRRPYSSNLSSRWRLDKCDIDINVSEALGKYVTFTVEKMSNMGMMTPFCGSKEKNLVELVPNVVLSSIEDTQEDTQEDTYYSMSSSKEDCLKDCGLCQSTLFYDEVSSSTQEDTQALEETRALEDTNDDANEEFNTLSYTSSSSCMMTPFCGSKENLDLIPNIVSPNSSIEDTQCQSSIFGDEESFTQEDTQAQEDKQYNNANKELDTLSCTSSSSGEEEYSNTTPSLDQSIFIRSPSPPYKIHTVAFHPSKKISDVKSEVQARLGLHPSEYILQLQIPGRLPKSLQDRCSLLDCNIHVDATLNIKLSIPAALESSVEQQGLLGGSEDGYLNDEMDERLAGLISDLDIEYGLRLHERSDDELKCLLQNRSEAGRKLVMQAFKVQLTASHGKKRTRLKRDELIAGFLDQKRNGFPRLRQSLMSRAERKVDGRARGKVGSRAGGSFERDATVDFLKPTLDTKIWETPGKDFEMGDHTSDPNTSMVKYLINSGLLVEIEPELLVAYKHKRKALLKIGDVSSLRKIDSLFELSVRRREPFLKTIGLVFGSDGSMDNVCAYRESIKKNESRCILFTEALFDWYANVDCVSLDDRITRLRESEDIESDKNKRNNWLESLVGLRLRVPEYWWKELRGRKSWMCQIDSVSPGDETGRFFVIRCVDHDPNDPHQEKRYKMAYIDVKKCADREHPGFSSFYLPEKPYEVYVDLDFKARCERTVRELEDACFSGDYFDKRSVILDRHASREVGVYIDKHRVTPEKVDEMIERYCRAQGLGLPWASKEEDRVYKSILTCACCGLRDMDGTSPVRLFHEVDLSYLRKLRLSMRDDGNPPMGDNDGNDLPGDNDGINKKPVSDRTQLKHRNLMEMEPISIPINDDGDTRDVELWRLCSTWPAKKPDELKKEKNMLPDYMFDESGNPVYYHLHPEFVEERDVPGQSKKCYTTTLCTECKGCIDADDNGGNVHNVPRRSIAAGVDFGFAGRIGLEPLTDRERQIISKVRNYLLVIKIESNINYNRTKEKGQSAVKGCGIYFDDDSPQVVSDLLSQGSINGDVSLQFVGPDGEYDSLAKRVFGSAIVEGRAWVIYQWLKVLGMVNSHYLFDNELPGFNDIKARLKAANEALVDNAECVNDESVLRETEISKDDARGIRIARGDGGVPEGVNDSVEPGADENESVSDSGVDIPFRCSFITSAVKGAKDVDRDFVSKAQDVLSVNRESDTVGDKQNVSRRERYPCCDYENGIETLTKSAPDVFLFGRAYNCAGPTLNSYDCRHLLMQFTTSAASNRPLIFNLFESNWRHGVIGSMHAKVSSNPQAFEQFANEFASEEFQNKIKAAIKDPQSPTGRYVMGKLVPVLNYAGRKSVFGALERNQSAGQILSMGRRFGCAPAFLTFGIDDINHPNSIRFALPSLNNTDFPSTVSSAARIEMKRGVRLKLGNEGSIPFNWGERFGLMMKNPVGAAIAYKEVVSDVMGILFGIDPSCSVKRTKESSLDGKMIGMPWAFFGKTETTGSGSLHFHVVKWGGLSPEFLESVADFPDLCRKVASVLDSMYSAKLDRHKHVQDLVQTNMKYVKSAKSSRRSVESSRYNEVSGGDYATPPMLPRLDEECESRINSRGLGVKKSKSCDTPVDTMPSILEESEEEDGTSNHDYSSPGAFALFSKSKKCKCGECEDYHDRERGRDGDAGQMAPSRYPGITITVPKKPLFSNEGGSIDGEGVSTVDPGRIPRAIILPPKFSDDGGIKFKTHVGVTVCSCGNIHTHSFTCRKPPKGWHGCRMCYSRALCDGGTKPIELVANLQADGSLNWEEYDSAVAWFEPGEEFVHSTERRTECSVSQGYVRSLDPEVHTLSQNNIYPFRSDCTRTIIWELDRPTLEPLSCLDEDKDNLLKEDLISILYRNMIADKPDRVPLVFEDGCEKISMDQVDFHHFDQQDKHSLFYSLLLGMIESSRLAPGEKSVECLRRELMCHLSGVGCDYKLGGKSLAQYIHSREGLSGVSIDEKISDYSQRMMCVGNDCSVGGELEVCLFADSKNFNVAVYEKDGSDLLRVESESYSARGANRPTIHLLRTSTASEEEGIGTHVEEADTVLLQLPAYSYTLFTPKLKSIMDRLQALDVDDLILLYNMVARGLPSRNGWVVDFNPILTGLLGSNTNLLHLGSTEQSKSALFYIGPYINKDGVKITDALPILLKAYEHAQNFPSVAVEDTGTRKRTVQHCLTRAVNKLNSLVEVTDTQASAYLVGLSASLCSESFVTCDIASREKFIEGELQRQGKDVYGYDGVDVSDIEEEKEHQGDVDEETILPSPDDFRRMEEEDDNGVDDESVGRGMKENAGCAIGLSAADRRTLAENRRNYWLSQREDATEDDFNHFNASYGPAPLYRKNDGTKMPVSYPALYRYRGKELAHMSYYMYVALVKVESVAETKGASGAGRKKCKPFAFAPGLGIEKYHYQVLRSKHMTPNFTPTPPPLPGDEPRPPDELDVEFEFKMRQYEKQLGVWRRKLNRFSRFYLTLFRAEDTLFEKGQLNTYEYDFKAFKRFYNHLSCSSSMIDRLTLQLMERVSYSWRVDSSRREMLAAYRGRARTLWSAQEKEATKSFYGRLQASSLRGDKGMDYVSSVEHILSDSQRTTAQKLVGHGQGLMDALNNLVRVTSETGADTEGTRHTSSVSNVTTSPFDVALDESKREVRPTRVEVEDDGVQRPPPTYRKIRDLGKKVDDYIKSQDLSVDKDVVVKIARDHFEAMRSGKAFDDEYEAPRLLVCGKPGNGKSKIIESLDGIVDIMKVGEQMKCCYMGSAAVNIRGTTLLRPWNIPVFNTGEKVTLFGWNQNVLQALKNRFDRNVYNICAVVIDEVSTVQPYMLAYLNVRMQTLFGNDKLFGGCMVILLGDFEQKPPTAGGQSGTLPGSVMRYIEEKGEPLDWRSGQQLGLTQMGGYLFTKFRYVKLTSQHRSGDPKHMAVINKMSDAGTGPAVQELKDTYKELSSGDLESDDFRFATVLVTGNYERRQINAWQAKRWAVYHGVNVVRWARNRRETSEHPWKGKPERQECLAHVLGNTCFWEYFIPGARGYLNTTNINADEGLANGTEIKYHSLSFTDAGQRQQFEEKCTQAEPGDVIYIESPPTAINVELFPDFDDDSPDERSKKRSLRRDWIQEGKGSSVNDGRVVIPISQRDGSGIPFVETSIPGSDLIEEGVYYVESRVGLKDYFPLEPSFSITTDKAQVGLHFCCVLAALCWSVLCNHVTKVRCYQGKTIRRLILSISEHSYQLNKLTWEGLYVSLSRVRRADHMRLLLKRGDWSTVRYVSKLRRNKYTDMFFEGYVDHPSNDGSKVWDYTTASTGVNVVFHRKKRKRKRKQTAAGDRATKVKKRGVISPGIKGVVIGGDKGNFLKK